MREEFTGSMNDSTAVLPPQKGAKTPSPLRIATVSSSSAAEGEEATVDSRIEGIVVASEAALYDDTLSNHEGATAVAATTIEREGNLSSEQEKKHMKVTSTVRTDDVAEKSSSTPDEIEVAEPLSRSSSKCSTQSNYNDTFSKSCSSSSSVVVPADNSRSNSNHSSDDTLSGCIKAISDQIRLFTEEIESMRETSCEDRLHASLTERLKEMRCKYVISNNDLIPAPGTVVLVRSIIEAFAQCPLTERDLRLRVADICAAAGVSTTSKGVPVGSSVEFNSICNMLVQLGVLELMTTTDMQSTNAGKAEFVSGLNSIERLDDCSATTTTGTAAAGALLIKLSTDWSERVDRYMSQDVSLSRSGAGEKLIISSNGSIEYEPSATSELNISADSGAVELDDGEEEGDVGRDSIMTLGPLNSTAQEVDSATAAATVVEASAAVAAGTSLASGSTDVQHNAQVDDFNAFSGRPTLMKSRASSLGSLSVGRKASKQKSKKNSGTSRVWKLRSDLQLCDASNPQGNSFASNPLSWLQHLSQIQYNTNSALEKEERVIRRLAGQCDFPMPFANVRTGSCYHSLSETCRAAGDYSDAASSSSFIGLRDSSLGRSSNDVLGLSGAAAVGGGSGVDSMDVYNTELQITADYLLEKVKSSKRQQGRCLQRQHSALLSNYLADLSAKEDMYLHSSATNISDAAVSRAVGIFDPSFIDSAHGICSRTASSVWRASASAEGEISIGEGVSNSAPLLADFAKDLLNEWKHISSTSNGVVTGSNAAIQAALLINNQPQQIDSINRAQVASAVDIIAIRRYALLMELEAPVDLSTAAAATLEAEGESELLLPQTSAAAAATTGSDQSPAVEVECSLPDLQINTREMPWSEVAKEFFYLVPSSAESEPVNNNDTLTTTAAVATAITSNPDPLKRSDSRASISSKNSNSNNSSSHSSSSSKRKSLRIQIDEQALPPVANMKRSISQSSNASDGTQSEQMSKKIRLYVSRPVIDLSCNSSSATEAMEDSIEGSAVAESGVALVDVVAPNYVLIESITERIKKKGGRRCQVMSIETEDSLSADRTAADGAVVAMDEDAGTEEDTSDECFAERHEQVLKQMRDKWKAIQDLRVELGVGTNTPGSHLRRRASFEFNGQMRSTSSDFTDQNGINSNANGQGPGSKAVAYSNAALATGSWTSSGRKGRISTGRPPGRPRKRPV